MTSDELEKRLLTTGFPVAYDHFVNQPPDPPYVVYLNPTTGNISSDEIVYGKWVTYHIELYTKKKNSAAEATVESVLNNINPDYTADETYIESEKMFQKVYVIEILEK